MSLSLLSIVPKERQEEEKHLLRKEKYPQKATTNRQKWFSPWFSHSFQILLLLTPHPQQHNKLSNLPHRIDAFHPDQGWKEIKTKTNQKTSWAEVRTIKRKWEKEKKKKGPEEDVQMLLLNGWRKSTWARLNLDIFFLIKEESPKIQKKKPKARKRRRRKLQTHLKISCVD